MLKAFTVDEINEALIRIFEVGMLENIEGKGECWLLAFSPFPTVLSKSLPIGCINTGLRGTVLNNNGVPLIHR